MRTAIFKTSSEVMAMATMLDEPVLPRTPHELLRARETPDTIRRQLAALPKLGFESISPVEAKIISQRKERLLLELGILEGWIHA
jgi:hypothetical protein